MGKTFRKLYVCNSFIYTTFGLTCDNIVSVQIVVCYQKPIPRDRLTFCAISNAPSNVNVILLFYGKVTRFTKIIVKHAVTRFMISICLQSNATVQFLRFHERQRSLEVNKCIQLSNCKELNQVGFSFFIKVSRTR
jgi:hypothetical protein